MNCFIYLFIDSVCFSNIPSDGMLCASVDRSCTQCASENLFLFMKTCHVSGHHQGFSLKTYYRKAMLSRSIRGGWIDQNIDSFGSADIGIGSILRLCPQSSV